VKWHRDVGAWIDVKGARTAIPVAPEEGEEEAAEDMWDDDDAAPLPYYPGQEPLLSFGNTNTVQSTVDERELVHPLAEGAEAYYTYAVGDSVTFKLPDGRIISLRELLVRPRISKWNVAVGSLWFDTSTGQLVRAAYRLAVPMDVWAIAEEEDSTAKDEVPVWVKPLVSPMRAQITAVAVEYGLYQGRFWLPRIRSAEGDANVSFMHVPFKYEQSFRYSNVNAVDPLPEIKVAATVEPPDSLSEVEAEKWRDSVRAQRRARRLAVRDSVKKGLRPEPIDSTRICDSTGTRTIMRRRRDDNMLVGMRIPCDVNKLYNSPDLPKSIYDEGEEVFGSSERDALIKEALSMGAQPPFAIGAIPPSFRYGLEFVRFNRIEGFSIGGMVEQKLGAGYTASLLARIGHADLEPNAELTLSRSNLVKTIHGSVYNRLVAANDWGNPLSFGSSLSGFLFGRDEGFYYRATGAEIGWQREGRALLTWRLFAERQRAASVENNWSLGPKFMPNIVASEGTYVGAATRLIHSYGLDPNGFRMYTDARLEGAMGDSSSAQYGRGALDLTFTQGLFGRYAAALTLSGGSSVGKLPPQRLWYLGGAHTVRGQRAGTAAGDAYWLGRFELGGQVVGVRPVIFGDIGWTGDRTKMQSVGVPMSGAGIGASFLDGLIRFDVSRGINPGHKIRVDMYVDAKF